MCSASGNTVWWAAGAGRGPGLTVIVVEGSHVPGLVWPAAVVVCGGWRTGRFDKGTLTRVWTGSCWVAASVVAAAAVRRGAWVVVGGGSWLGLGFGLGRCRLDLCRCVCGVVGCVGWCWWWCCCWWWARLGAGLGLGSGFRLESGSRLRRTSVWRCVGASAGLGVFPVCCRGALVACVGVGGSPVVWRAATALAFAVALWMRSAGRGGSADEVDDVDEAEEEEEVVVLGDAGRAVMRVVAGSGAAASAAATAGTMEGMSSGFSFGVGGWWADLVGSGGGGRRGAVAFSFWAWLGRGPAMCEAVSIGVREGGQFARAAFGGRGGWAWVFWGVRRERVRATWRAGRDTGPWGSPRWVCAGCRVWGAVRGVQRVGPWRACAVVWAGGGGPCRGARGCARWWACVGLWVGSERGGVWAGIARWGVMCRCMCPLAAARLRGQL